MRSPTFDALRSSGLGALWIVTEPTKDSTLGDVLFQATPDRLALQVLGGLKPSEILGWYDSASEANQIALQALHLAGATTSGRSPFYGMGVSSAINNDPAMVRDPMSMVAPSPYDDKPWSYESEGEALWMRGLQR